MQNRSKTVQKAAVVVLVAGVVAAFFALDLGQYFTLEYLKQSQAELQGMYEANRAVFIAAYFAVYVAMAGLSLPGATVMSLAGGAVFGFWTGVVVVSFASTVGATLACVVARFLLGNYVQRRFGDKLRTINEGIQREGAFYLFTLRLVPVFPFFVVNLVMGLTPIKLLTYYTVSQIGMFPATLVYVNAGKQLGQIQSLSDVASPELLVSFALLGIFPLAAKKLVALVRKRRGQAA